MNLYVKLVLCVAAAYFLGNISPATLVGRFYGVDIKKVGSGNAGTTNVLRTLGWGPAAITLVIDILKGYIAVRLGLKVDDLLGGELCFLAVLVGHVYPVIFHFKGGKGVATSLGAAWAINWPSAFAVLLVAALGAGTSKKMSIGSVAACLAYPLLVLFYYPVFFPVSIIAALFVLFNHRTNLQRLYRGEEKSMSVGDVTTSDDETDDKKEETATASGDEQNEQLEGVREPAASDDTGSEDEKAILDASDADGPGDAEKTESTAEAEETGSGPDSEDAEETKEESGETGEESGAAEDTEDVQTTEEAPASEAFTEEEAEDIEENEEDDDAQEGEDDQEAEDVVNEPAMAVQKSIEEIEAEEEADPEIREEGASDLQAREETADDAQAAPEEEPEAEAAEEEATEEKHKRGGLKGLFHRVVRSEDDEDETEVIQMTPDVHLEPDDEAADIESDRDLQWIFREAEAGSENGGRGEKRDEKQDEKPVTYGLSETVARGLSQMDGPVKGTVAMIARGESSPRPSDATAIYYGMPKHPGYVPRKETLVTSEGEGGSEPAREGGLAGSASERPVPVSVAADDKPDTSDVSDASDVNDGDFAEFDQLVEEARKEAEAKKAAESRIVPVDYYKGQKKKKKPVSERRKVAFIGNGSFGTALANLLAQNGHTVTMWGRDKEYLNQMRETRVNSKYLPEIILSSSLRFTHNLKTAVHGKDLVVFAVPAQNFRQVAERVARHISGDSIVVNLAKGIETQTNMTMSQIAEEIMPDSRYVVLSGPSHAEEIGKNKPATVVVASKDEAAAKTVQDIFMSEKFRVYTSDDVLGVELGGALKNVIAIGTGISDGMGFGDNARSAIMTRGIHEMTRLGVKLGAKGETFSGLSGIGDLMVTCDSQLSRNRRCGIMIGQGVKPYDAVKQIGTVEGFYTVDAACKLAEKAGVEMPITQAVNKVIRGEIAPDRALELLMGRDKKDERI